VIDYQADLEQRMAMLAAANQRLEREIRERVKSETNLRESEERLSYLAQYDSLTRLPNRHWFHDHLTRAMASARRAGATLAVLFIDLDRFKAVNDTFGHPAGDQLLIEVSNRLGKSVRSADVVARLRNL
jgi:GGDEF domain-containing protein